jgi:hypothetical protein
LVLSPTASIYLGFTTEGRLAAVLIIPSLGVPNWSVIYINTTPSVSHQDLQLVVANEFVTPTDSALAVADSLAARRLNGFSIRGADAQAVSIASINQSALGQKDSKRNLFPELNYKARLRSKGQ